MAKFLKICAPFITKPLTHIINRSLQETEMPSLWKSANVTPIHKGGSTELSNYRPISVLPAISKILERVFMIQFTTHLSDNSLLSEHQSGFQPGYSTADVMLHMIDLWRKAIDKGLLTGTVFLNLSKAFDCVDHFSYLQNCHIMVYVANP